MSAAAAGSGAEFRLVPLDCPTCGAGVKAEGEDVVYYCTACRNGYRLDPKAQGLEPTEVAFVSLPSVEAGLYKPFWLLPAKVVIQNRDARGGGFSGLMSFFLGDRDAGASGEGTFAVPAFHAPLAAVTALTRAYTERFPELGEKLGERLLGGCYGVEDARKLAEYTVIATEVGKPDLLRDLAYKIEFGPERLLGVPFVRRGDVVADSIFGIQV